MTRTFSDIELAACARRELAMRRKVYPRWVGGRLTQQEADAEIAKMAAIAELLEERVKAAAPRLL